VIKQNSIIFGDSLEIMKGIKDKSIDMILCDLPYGETSNEEDNMLDFTILWNHYERIIKESGNIILFAQGLFFVDLVNSNRKLFKYEWIWDKQLCSGFLNAKKRPLRQHEQVCVFYKKLGTYNPQMTIGVPSHSKGTKHLIKNIVNNNYNKIKAVDTDTTNNKKYPKSIISFSKPHPSVALHRTAKSVELCEYLIKTYSNKNDIILDNCAGSGTTGVACLHTNRNYIMIEKNKKYYDIAVERLKNEEL
jgi:site-specific DNA-methyltransferase (adenine-specific)